MHDQAVFVAADIEDHTVVPHEIDGRSEHGLHIGGPEKFALETAAYQFTKGVSARGSRSQKARSVALAMICMVTPLFPYWEYRTRPGPRQADIPILGMILARGGSGARR